MVCGKFKASEDVKALRDLYFFYQSGIQKGRMFSNADPIEILLNSLFY